MALLRVSRAPVATKAAPVPLHRDRAATLLPLSPRRPLRPASPRWDLRDLNSSGTPQGPRDRRMAFATSGEEGQGGQEAGPVTVAPAKDDGADRKARVLRALALHGWAIAVGAFLVINYFWGTSAWPGFLMSVDVRMWALVHAVSGMLFAGGILVTSVLEFLVVRSGSDDVQQFWFSAATKAEWLVVLPGLTGSMVSGIAQAWQMYQCPIKFAPLHVKLPIHVMALFAVWWMLTDVATRDAAKDKKKQGKRLISNLVSCLFVFALYGIMVLKPGM